jgi:hypothetical protein
MSANNIHAFIESDNDTVIKRIHALIARLVVNRKASLLLATDVNMNEVIQVASYLKPGSYVLMTFDKIDCALISMFSKFIMCVNVLIVKARAMYMSAGHDELADEYVSSSCGWLVVYHDGEDFVIKQFFGVSVYWIDLQLWIRYKLVFGLAVLDEHGIQACNDMTMAVLKRYSIRRSDIILPINDTANASVAIG